MWVKNEAVKQGVVEGLRKLRRERRLTQAELSKVLGLSQAHLAKIEHGQGMITAEQLIRLVQKYGLSLSYFVQEVAQPYGENPALQNALAYLGAHHLRIVPDVQVPERLALPEESILETLLSSSARMITALAPVIVRHCEKINFYRMAEKLRVHGVQNRIWWLAESIHLALSERLKEVALPRSLDREYQTAYLILERKKLDAAIVQENLREDELEEGLVSPRTVEFVKKNRDKLAKRWGIVTRIKKEDFLQALKDAET